MTIGFAVGGMAHAVSFALALRGVYLYGTGYPTWRHAVMATVDACIVAVGWFGPRWLPAAVAAFTLEQSIVNGLSPFTVIGALALAALVWERRRRDARSVKNCPSS